MIFYIKIPFFFVILKRQFLMNNINEIKKFEKDEMEDRTFLTGCTSF